MRMSDKVSFIIRGNTTGYDELGNIVTTPDTTTDVYCHVSFATDVTAFTGYAIGFGKIATGGIKIRMRISEFDPSWTQAIHEGDKYSLQSVELGNNLITIHGVRVYG